MAVYKDTKYIKTTGLGIEVLEGGGQPAPQQQQQQQGSSNVSNNKMTDYQNCFVIMQYYHYFVQNGMGDDAAERAAVHVSMSLGKGQVDRDKTKFKWREPTH